MAKTKLIPMSVYMTKEQRDIVRKVATLENRSVSNALLSLALQKASEMGVEAQWKKPGSPHVRALPKKTG